MKKLGQSRVEWGLLSVIAVLCAVLSFLQYRWTGELSRAEPVLLRAGLNEQIRRLVQSFNDEVRENCSALLPDAEEMRQHGMAGAHGIRYGQWLSSHDPLIFNRIGVAVPEEGSLNLYSLEEGGRIVPSAWPADWGLLRTGMIARMSGQGRRPNTPANSTAIELPVFSGPNISGATGPELEWMIFNLNQDYVRTKLLPRLAAEYLNPEGESIYDLSVSWTNPGGSVIFSTRGDGASVATGADASAGIFSSEMGTAPNRGRGRGRSEARPSRWTIAARHREGSLDAAVSRARYRNLAASLLLVGLLGGTAWALVRYTARSRRLSEMQFRFAAGVSHDLRTPLTAIRGAAFNLVEGLVHEPAAVKRYLKMILRNAEELTSMIENVLAFSASIHPRADGGREPFAVGDVLHHAAATMTQEIEQAGCHLEVTVAPELPVLEGDRMAIELMFRNLIGNAVRHGAGGKWIGVSAAPYINGVEVRVCDHGPGIPQDERERIFEPFYRGEQTRAQRVQGTGLGLSLVKNTVERHKGSIEVHNASGGGAQFTVRLPMLQAV